MDQRLSAESLQESVKKQVAERPGLLSRAGPAALTAVLGAAALWPVVAPLLGGGVALGVATGAIGLLGGPGGGFISDFLERSLERLRGRDEPEARAELERELLERLAADPGLRAEVSRLLERDGAVEAALAASPPEARDELATRLAELGEQWREFRWMLGAVQSRLEELQARQIEALALQRTTLDLQREQLVKTNLLLRRQEPAPAARPSEGNGAADLAPAPVASPYKGLEPFQPEDAERFFGRDELIAALLARLAEAPFLGVVGPSGSGKSSVVRAGVIPALWAGRLPGSDRWRTLIMTPGDRPLEELAQRLALERGIAAGSLLDDLRARPDGLRLAVEQSLLDEPDGRLVLVVDQFEEVFTLCRDAGERMAFATGLAEAGERAVVIVGLRADFYGHAARLGRFADVLGSHQELVGPMSRDELRDAIVRPAEGAGLQLEPGLADAIVDDVADEPGALPLLSHALLATFERRRGTQLTLEGYRESGGVRGAIARTADSLFEERLDGSQQAIARRVLLRLIELGEGTEATRRRVAPEALVPAGEPPGPVEGVVRTLVDARLLTAGDDTVEVAHEALIREWPRLRGWLDENRAGLEVHHRLTEAADEWVDLGREPAALLRGSRLLSTKEWAEQQPGDLNALEREFLDASVEAERDELEAARSRTRRLRRLSIGLAVVALLAVGAAIFGVDRSREAADQRDAAEREATIALSGSLAAQSAAELDDRLDLSMLTALEAYRQERTPQAREALLRAIELASPQIKQLHGHTAAVASLAYSADGTRLASGAHDGSARLWDVAGGTQIGEPLVEGRDRAPHVAMAPDAGVIGVAGSRAITLYDADSREEIARWRIPERTISAAAASRDGRIFAFRALNSSLYVVDVPGRRILRRPVGRGPVAVVAVGGMALDDSGDHLAMLEAGELTLWRVEKGGPRLRIERLPLEGAGGFYPQDEPDFDAAGRVVAARGSDGKLRRWDIRSGAQLPEAAGVGGGYGLGVVDLDSGTLAVTGETADTLAIRRGGRRSWPTDQGITAVALAPGGERLAAGGERGTIEIWDTTRHVAFGSPIAVSASAIALDPKGDVVATGSFDGSVGLWNARTGEEIERELAPAQPDGNVGWVAFSATGDEITAVYSKRGRVSARIWPRSPAIEPPQPIVLSEYRIEEFGEFPELSPDGSTLAWVHEGEIRIWSIRENRTREVAPIDGVSADAVSQGVAFSPDSRTIVAWSNETVVLLAADASGEPVRLPQLGTVSEAAVSRDTVALDVDTGVRLWDRRTRRLVARDLPGGSVGSLQFSPDGSRLAAVSGTMDVWDVRARRRVAQGLAVTPDTEVGHELAFAGGRPTLIAKGEERPYIVDPIVFSTDLADFEERVCAVVNRNLRRDELLSFPSDREPGRCVD